MRTGREQQFCQDLEPDMRERDRSLRISVVRQDGCAECVDEHDLAGAVGRTVRNLVPALANPAKFALPEEGNKIIMDPRYTIPLSALSAVHCSRTATPHDYAPAACDALGLSQESSE